METTTSGIIDQSKANTAPAARITQVFERAQQESRGVLIPYLMSGYPTAAQSIELVLAAAHGGADLIELGMPFSDPLADGATVQHAGHIALEAGMTINGCMQVASQVAAQCSVPLILMGYYNPILSYGIERFCEQARASGICGMIIPDLPVEEAGPLHEATQRNGLALIYLIPPTTPDERIASIVEQAAKGLGGFIYCVSLSGVTGSRQSLPPHLRSFIARVRNYTTPKHLPIAVGFGLSTPAHIAEVTSYADGAAVGSALINLIDRHEEGEQAQAVEQYIRSLRQQ
jgi:tryptophan synthase alpha chain